MQTRQPKFRIEGLLQKVADFALGRGITDIERLSRDLARSSFRAQEGRPYLRPIAMGENDAVAITHQLDDFCRRVLRVHQLLSDCAFLASANQRVPAYRQQHGLHGFLLRVHQFRNRYWTDQPYRNVLHQFQHDRLLDV